jgi:GNAT superfamily N-acetyltransferase
MTERTELKFAEIHSDEYSKLFAFYAATLHGAERARVLYEWRLRGQPASGGIRTFAARSGDRIVGSISIVMGQLGLGGARIQMATHHDTIVAEGYRGCGIGSKLLNLSAEGVPLVIAKGTLPAMYALRKRMGFRDVPRSKYLLRVLAPITTTGSLRKRLALPPLYLISRLRREGACSSSLRTCFVQEFDADFDALCHRITAGAEATPVKDSQYLNWRYTDCPIRTYLIIRTEEGRGRLRGAAVIRPNSKPYQDAWLVDMIVETDDQEAQHALLDACFAELRRRKTACVRTFATSPGMRRTLTVRGFREIGDTPRFTYRFGKALLEFQAAPWNFWHGDSDSELLG